MRKVIFSIPVTLDGFIEGPHRELDWVIPDDELHDFYAHLLKSSDVILYGRVTYELMANYWPKAPADPSASAAELRFAEALNPMKKIVFSHTIQNVDWNTQVMKAFIPQEIERLKEQDGGNILLGGGATLAHTFMQHDLIDEYWLLMMPVAIGAGKALFSGISEPLMLDFISSQTFQSGAVLLRYRPSRKATSLKK